MEKCKHYCVYSHHSLIKSSLSVSIATFEMNLPPTVVQLTSLLISLRFHSDLDQLCYTTGPFPRCCLCARSALSQITSLEDYRLVDVGHSLPFCKNRVTIFLFFFSPPFACFSAIFGNIVAFCWDIVFSVCLNKPRGNKSDVISVLFYNCPKALCSKGCKWISSQAVSGQL